MNYEKIYNDIISKARSEDRKKIKGGIYYESHHIIPRCIGGNNDKSNLILLTAKEHYMAHRLLCLIYPNHKGLYYAIWNMINGRKNSHDRYMPSGRIYAQLRESYMNKLMSEESRYMMRQSHINRPPISEETRKKQSIAAKNRPLKGPMSEEQKKKISAANKGRIMPIMTEEHKSKISKSLIGKYVSEETRKKMATSGMGRRNSEESKQNMRAAQKNRLTISDETRKKMSDSHKGHIISDETKKKMSKANKGRCYSDEAKLKMVEVWKIRRLNLKK